MYVEYVHCEVEETDPSAWNSFFLSFFLALLRRTTGRVLYSLEAMSMGGSSRKPFRQTKQNMSRSAADAEYLHL